jgi:hypothetical protein
LALILPDVNVLVYAYRPSAPDHPRYARWLNDARRNLDLGLVDAVLLGMVRVVSDPRIFGPAAAPTAAALEFVDLLRAAPGALSLTPTEATWGRLRALTATDVRIRGRLVPDAWLAALAISHGARLATADRGFGRFPGLDFFDPVDQVDQI